MFFFKVSEIWVIRNFKSIRNRLSGIFSRYPNSRYFSNSRYFFQFLIKKKNLWVYIWQFLALKRGRCGNRNLSSSLSKICRFVVGGFRRIFDRNLYILTFFDSKSGPLSLRKQMFPFNKKMKRNVYIWQFLAQKRGCG